MTALPARLDRKTRATARPWAPRLSLGQLRLLGRHRRRLGWVVLGLPVVLVVLVDIALRGQRLAELEGKYLASYAAAVAESAALWGLLLYGAAERRGRLRWAWALLLVALGTAAVGGQIYFHGQYSTYLNLDATLFGTSMTASTWSQVMVDLPNFLAAMMPVAGVAVALVWLGRILVRPRRRWLRVVWPLAAAMSAAVFVIPCSYRSVQGSTPDVIYFHAMGGLFKQLGGEHRPSELRPGRRTPPQLPQLEAEPARPRNVVFILLEGVRADVTCPSPRETCPTMPETNTVMPNRLGLDQLRSNSSTTAIELAVLWSGLPPTASRKALHTAPLLFDYAHAAGYATAYWTSQHMLFANSRLYVADLPTRFQCGATHLDPLADIDLGADDRLLTQRARSELPQLPEPFFAVVHYGNTHMPYLVEAADAPFQPAVNSRAPANNEGFFNRYRNAIHYQDKTIAELVRFIRAAPFGRRTIVFLTSDHGEAFREHGQLGHTGSVFDVEIHVPGWFDAPRGTLTEDERRELESQRRELVFHSDITPTILDLLGLWDTPALADYRAAMVGHSLLRPARPAVTLALTNCTGIWGCAFQNWGVMHAERKLLAREWDRSWLCYDVLADPEELHPLPLGDCGALATEAEQIYGGLPGTQ